MCIWEAGPDFCTSFLIPFLLFVRIVTSLHESASYYPNLCKHLNGNTLNTHYNIEFCFPILNIPSVYLLKHTALYTLLWEMYHIKTYQNNFTSLPFRHLCIFLFSTEADKSVPSVTNVFLSKLK